MGKEILTKNQKNLLEKFSSEDFIKDFYLTGGTALAAFYLNHRYSEDLDFFTEKEDMDVAALTFYFESLKPKLGIEKIDFEKSLNRNLFFFHFNEDVVKTEFTFFPFKQIEAGKIEKKLKVDSLLDIAVNKLFTIYQRPRARDFIDLYLTIREKDYGFDDLIMKTKAKFDWPIDFLNLGSQMLKAKELKDYPRMIKEFNQQETVDFFAEEALKLKSKIVQ